ncbi:MAG: hypothetical protein UV64_C0019G0008 [Parcubacteria group bacterium GW2011_GWC1_43_11b]|nr:MAG: hypothetical protein UV64_C0019G0008 [Parcubacteria group bacterium GW2011_GWC1_43_11b]
MSVVSSLTRNLFMVMFIDLQIVKIIEQTTKRGESSHERRKEYWTKGYR